MNEVHSVKHEFIPPDTIRTTVSLKGVIEHVSTTVRVGDNGKDNPECACEACNGCGWDADVIANMTEEEAIEAGLCSCDLCCVPFDGEDMMPIQGVGK